MSNDFHGLPTRSLGNDYLTLDYLAESGPRILGLFLAGSHDNLLAEAHDISWDTPHGTYRLHGGHRLWHAPEAFPRTYMPDDGGLEIDVLDDGVRLRQPVEESTGVQKVMELRLHVDRPALTVQHSLHNNGQWTIELAPWAITQVPLGGVAVLPQQAPVPSQYLPNRQLNLWSYTSLRDPRLRLDDDVILIDGQAGELPFKIGTFNHAGWMGYLRNGVFFVKRFDPKPQQLHPDQHSNCEVYVWNRFLEVETLGPLVQMEPGAATTHVETWEFYPGVQVDPAIEGVRDLIADLGLA